MNNKLHFSAIAGLAALAFFAQGATAQAGSARDSIAYKEFAMGPPQVVSGDGPGSQSSFSISVGPDPYIPLGMVVPPSPPPPPPPPGPAFGPGGPAGPGPGGFGPAGPGGPGGPGGPPPGP